MPISNLDDRKESCKSYLEQTKLLVTLASAFLLPPAFIYTVLKVATLNYLLISEGSFVASVFFGYIVFGSIAGSQRSGEYDVYRPATRVSSLLQIGAYLVGLVFFVLMCLQLDVGQEQTDTEQRPGAVQQETTISDEQWHLASRCTGAGSLCGAFPRGMI